MCACKSNLCSKQVEIENETRVNHPKSKGRVIPGGGLKTRAGSASRLTSKKTTYKDNKDGAAASNDYKGACSDDCPVKSSNSKQGASNESKGTCCDVNCPENISNSATQTPYPGPNPLDVLKVKLLRIWSIVYNKVCKDPFRWQLFKSIIFFAMGLKLFNDLSKHMAQDGPNNC